MAVRVVYLDVSISNTLFYRYGFFMVYYRKYCCLCLCQGWWGNKFKENKKKQFSYSTTGCIKLELLHCIFKIKQNFNMTILFFFHPALFCNFYSDIKCIKQKAKYNILITLVGFGKMCIFPGEINPISLAWANVIAFVELELVMMVLFCPINFIVFPPDSPNKKGASGAAWWLGVNITFVRT